MLQFRLCRKQLIIILGLLISLSAIQGSNEESQDPLLICKNGKWGYADRTGKIVIKPRFAMGEFFVNGLAKVWDKHKTSNFYFINRKAEKIIIPNVVSYGFSEGLAVVEIAGKYGYVDEVLKTVIAPQFEYAGDFSEGLAPAKINGKYGYIDHTGKFLIQPQFDEAEYFSEGLAAIGFLKQDKKCEFGVFNCNQYGFINKAGEIVIKPIFDDASHFSDELAAVSIEGRLNYRGSLRGKCGYIDKTGKLFIALKFNDAQDFSEGLAAVMVGEKFGYIDKYENFIIPPQFENAREFQKGLAYASIGKTIYKFKGSVVEMIFHGKMGYINRTGRFVSSKLCWQSP